jgi:3-mercaptopyruvate sulfurtransferase SseA
MQDLGVQPDDILVVYDLLEVGLYSSPRVAWAYHHFGHRDVHVLNNFPRYVSQGYPVESGPSHTLDTKPSHYPVKEPDAREVISYEELRDSLISSPKHDEFQIIDARIAGRFSGKEPELNPTLRSGHMPAALNVPLASILGAEKTILPADELRNVFQAAGVKDNVPAVLTCNSGVTAAALDLALQLSGYGMERRLYDGSWMEWTRRADDEGLIVNSPQ